jgi:uncharacterized protein (DUF488 family)
LDFPECYFTMEHYMVWTIGHSTRSIGEFIEILKSADIQILADVRRFPGSRAYPHFNKETLSESLKKQNIRYIHLPELGGRRKAKKDSRNTAWRNEAFRGYADYMETLEFKEGMNHLESLAKEAPTAMMCSEVVWWRCHRSLISDYLKSEGWQVIHLMDKNKTQEHPYTSASRIVEGKLNYEENNSQLNIDY